MRYPDLDLVERASHAQLWDWYKHLDEPQEEHELEIWELVEHRIHQFSGAVPPRTFSSK
jgi:hypothetical protein